MADSPILTPNSASDLLFRRINHIGHTCEPSARPSPLGRRMACVDAAALLVAQLLPGGQDFNESVTVGTDGPGGTQVILRDLRY